VLLMLQSRLDVLLALLLCIYCMCLQRLCTTGVMAVEAMPSADSVCGVHVGNTQDGECPRSCVKPNQRHLGPSL
jgi:hypothetical protein